VPLHLSSTRSPRVRALKELHRRSGRQAQGVFIVEGRHGVAQAWGRGHVREIWVREGTEVPEGWSIDVVGTAAVFAAVAPTATPQGILAVCAIPHMQIGDVLDRPGQVLVLDGIADPGNAGTLIRTAAAVGAAGVLFTAGSVDPTNDKVVRSTAGTWFDVPIAVGADARELHPLIRHSGRMLVGLDAQATTDLYAAIESGDITSQVAWLIGSEAHGISTQFEPDMNVSIPMAAGVESLNAAVAGALCLYANRHAPGNRGSSTII
jgi:RNA methyltransferase, TrmH family